MIAANASRDLDQVLYRAQEQCKDFLWITFNAIVSALEAGLADTEVRCVVAIDQPSRNWSTLSSSPPMARDDRNNGKGWTCGTHSQHVDATRQRHETSNARLSHLASTTMRPARHMRQLKSWISEPLPVPRPISETLPQPLQSRRAGSRSSLHLKANEAWG
jgi:hypothetical protein